MTTSNTCTFADVEAAREKVYQHLSPTPLHEYGGISECVGARVFVKHENHHVVGAFKVRGGVNLASSLGDAERNAGLCTASTGNHGQSIAYAGKVTGARVQVAVPEGANPSKVASMQRLGAEVIHQGDDFDEAREWMAQQASKQGARFIGPTDAELIAGVGTYTLEIMEALPDAEVIFVPVGAGSGASSVALVAKTINPMIKVVAVQARKAPAIYESWKNKKLCESSMETDAEGLATRVAHQNTLSMLLDPRTGIDDFLLVSDQEMADAVRLYVEHAHNIAELAGAAALAGALQMRESIAGAKVVVVLSGGNLATAKLKRIMDGTYSDVS